MLLTSLKTLPLILLVAVAGCGDDSPTTCGPCPDGGSSMGSDGSMDACCNDGGIDASPDGPFVCDPVAQTGCTGGKACYSDLYSNPQAPYECSTPGAGTDGTSCTANSDCAAGFWCAKGGLNKCTHYCTTDAQCTASGSPTCMHDQAMQYPFGYCACANPPGIGTCP